MWFDRLTDLGTVMMVDAIRNGESPTTAVPSVFLAALVLAKQDPDYADRIRDALLREVADGLNVPLEIIERQLQEMFAK